MTLASLIRLCGSLLRVRQCSVFYFLFYPPTRRGHLLLLYYSALHSMEDSLCLLGIWLSLYLRRCRGKTSGSFSVWVLASPISIPNNMSTFFEGFEDLHRGGLHTLQKNRKSLFSLWRPVAHIIDDQEKIAEKSRGENPTYFGVREHLTPWECDRSPLILHASTSSSAKEALGCRLCSIVASDRDNNTKKTLDYWTKTGTE